MGLGDIVTFHDGTSWVNRVEGSEETFGRHPDKDDAATAGASRAEVAHVNHHVEDPGEDPGEDSGEGPGEDPAGDANRGPTA